MTWITQNVKSSSSNIGNKNLLITDANRELTLKDTLATTSYTINRPGGGIGVQVIGTMKVGIGGAGDNTRVCRIYGTGQTDSAHYFGIGNGFIDPSTANTIRFGGTSSQKFTFTNNSPTVRLTIDTSATAEMLLADSFDIATGTTTGSMFPKTSSQKWGAYGATPVAQQAHIADVTGTPAGTDAAIIDDLKTQLNLVLAWQATMGFTAAS